MSSVMDEYNSIMLQLNSAIDSVLENEVAESIISDLQVSAIENVYNQYVPSLYERRYGSDGGLMAHDSFEKSVSGDHTLTIENIARGQQTDVAIVDIVESGKGYEWTHSRIYREHLARPFMEEGLQKGISDGGIEAALQSGLVSRGF